VSHPAEPGELIGSFLVTVDPTAGERSVRIVPLRNGIPKASTDSLLADVTLVGPGQWDPSTQRMTATVRIENGSAPSMDEPYIVVTAVNKARSCIAFERAHSGGTYTGATYRFADITAPGLTEVNHASARQTMVIHDPCVTDFRFQVDVRAVVRGSRRIVPDRDDDSFNIEANEPAGDDCNDFDAQVYPGGPVSCDCTLSCNTCPNGCCTETCTGSCSQTCTSGCVCDLTPGAGGSGTMDCEAGSVCNLDCTEATEGCTLNCSNASCTSYCQDTRSPKTCTENCSNGSACVQQCLGVGGRCEIRDCSGGSDCTIDCAGTRSDCKVWNGCLDGATCNVTCDTTGGSCQTDVCRNASTCNVECNGDTDANCTVDRCDTGSTCNVVCNDAVRGTCGISSCTNGSTCHATCNDTSAGKCSMSCDATSSCTLDCGDYPSKSCSLQCSNGRATRCPSTNVWVCPGTPCP
jgi:hypothetical protein